MTHAKVQKKGLANGQLKKKDHPIDDKLKIVTV